MMCMMTGWFRQGGGGGVGGLVGGYRGSDWVVGYSLLRHVCKGGLSSMWDEGGGLVFIGRCGISLLSSREPNRLTSGREANWLSVNRGDDEVLNSPLPH